MKSVIGGTILALILFAIGAASWKEAGLTRSVADAHRRLATLHYDPEDDIDTSTVWSRAPWPIGAAGEDVTRHRATVSYWLLQYDSLIDMTKATGQQAVTDPSLLFVAANASFRNSAPQVGDRKAAIERLDGVIQAYADVLRKNAGNADAAFNYEFVWRTRDSLARLPGKSSPKKAPPAQEIVSVDLPTGPTVHGRPGGPPEGTDMSDFKTITPMRYDEREEQMDPGRGKELRRKG
jgi:hypothetical protein